MAGEDGKCSPGDFYAVLGLKKECSASDLRNAYKKLAMKWHPDRCSATGSSKYVEEAKDKFQAIQEAYSVLSDSNKRFLYDVGVYDVDDDDDQNGMGDFLDEMAAMMNQNQPSDNGAESFEELQELFEEMFQTDLGGLSSTSRSGSGSTCSSSSSMSFNDSCINAYNKRNSSEMSSAVQFGGFCIGVQHLGSTGKGRGPGRGITGRVGSSGRRAGRKQKVSSGHDVSSGGHFNASTA